MAAPSSGTATNVCRVYRKKRPTGRKPGRPKGSKAKAHTKRIGKHASKVKHTTAKATGHHRSSHPAQRKSQGKPGRPRTHPCAKA